MQKLSRGNMPTWLTGGSQSQTSTGMTPRYSKCPICDDTGLEVVIVDNHEWAKRCECLQAEILANKIKNSNIPEKFKAANLTNFTVDNNNRQARESAYSFIARWEQNPKGIIFNGSVGTGKTHLAVAILNNIMVKKEIVPVFVNTPEFIADLRQEQFEPGGTGHMISRAKECPLICFDDLAKEKMTEWVREQYYRIINHRYTKQLPVIITTNCSMDELGEKLGDATASRLTAMCEVIEIKGRDRRN